jgi:hypothetical protein
MTEAEVLSRFNLTNPNVTLCTCLRCPKGDGVPGYEWNVTHILDVEVDGTTHSFHRLTVIDDETGEVVFSEGPSP